MRSVSIFLLLAASLLLWACSSNPYAATNKSYKKQVNAYAKILKTRPTLKPGQDSLQAGDYWVGTTNLNMRKPNFVIIHHTAQHSTEQTLKTFTLPRTQVSAHYVIGRDGKVYHMLNDYLRSWHAGAGKWGNTTDLNSTSIGIELDNDGAEPFPEAQITSLLKLLGTLKKNYAIPAANFLGHSDIAPARKVDPSPLFPWKRLADRGFGLWYDEELLKPIKVDSMVIANISLLPADSTTLIFPQDSLLTNFNPEQALRIIGYDTKNLNAAIRAFKIHFIQKDINPVLSKEEKRVLQDLYKKYW